MKERTVPLMVGSVVLLLVVVPSLFVFAVRRYTQHPQEADRLQSAGVHVQVGGAFLLAVFLGL